MQLYVAGPMTGIDEMNFPAFFEAERRLQEAGFEVKNPAQHGAGNPDMSWADYMRIDITDMLTCDGIALLPGWERSSGARIEHYIACALEIPVKPLEEWLDPKE